MRFRHDSLGGMDRSILPTAISALRQCCGDPPRRNHESESLEPSQASARAPARVFYTGRYATLVGYLQELNILSLGRVSERFSCRAVIRASALRLWSAGRGLGCGD
jgi:hypothetical protein